MRKWDTNRSIAACLLWELYCEYWALVYGAEFGPPPLIEDSEEEEEELRFDDLPLFSS